MRISDWSSDVCSSDLFGASVVVQHRGTLFTKRCTGAGNGAAGRRPAFGASAVVRHRGTLFTKRCTGAGNGSAGRRPAFGDRKSVVSGKSLSVRVDLGGRRIIKKNRNTNNNRTR